jgi:glycerol uptake facilitator-like aquaporin
MAAPAAEFLGVMILIIFGNGVWCQVVLSQDPKVASFPHGVSSIACSLITQHIYVALPFS